MRLNPATDCVLAFPMRRYESYGSGHGMYIVSADGTGGGFC